MRGQLLLQPYGNTKIIKDYYKQLYARLPWRSSGWDSVLPVQGTQVPSLVGELGFHMPHGMAKKNPQKTKTTVCQKLGNSYEMEKFLKRHKLLKLTQEEIENLNRSLTSKEIELVI